MTRCILVVFRPLLAAAALAGEPRPMTFADVMALEAVTLDGYFGAEPWDDFDAYSNRSAMRFIKQAKTPTLILHGGDDDLRVPIGQAQELYMGLLKNDVPAELAIYPREGHALQEPRHQLDKMERQYAWFARWVLGEKPTETSAAGR